MTTDFEKKGHMRIMTFNNPEKRNALGIKDFLEIERIDDEVTADPGIEQYVEDQLY